MRVFATLLSIRCRLEMAAGNFEKAVYTLQTGFALARHVGEGPTLIHGLIGHAIAAIMFERLTEFVQQPDAPNLYWALTTLPPSLVDIRHALQGEVVMLSGYLPDLRDLERPMTIARAREVFEELLRKTGQWSGERGFETALQRFVAAGWLAQAYPRSKEHLIAAGRDRAEVEAMPTVQVVLLDTFSEFHRLRDDQFKAFHLSYRDARPILARADDELKKVVAANPSNFLLNVMAMLLPAVEKIHQTTGRTERRIALLRTIEAVRMHAAANEGRPPARLEDITAVPVPNDPLTGKPFGYVLKDGIAELTAPREAGIILRYELRFVK
jgi:hypothetical protein